jgi:ribonuclease R
VTIDGEDARDFDDAVYCSPRPKGGWRLIVAIADVGSYVKLGFAARHRGARDVATPSIIPIASFRCCRKRCPTGCVRCGRRNTGCAMVCDMQVSPLGKVTTYRF